jgi:hypothetical protein
MAPTELPIRSYVRDLTAPSGPNEVASMIKSLLALSIFALFGASVIALPYASAGETAASAKGDRLDTLAG